MDQESAINKRRDAGSRHGGTRRKSRINQPFVLRSRRIGGPVALSDPFETRSRRRWGYSRSKSHGLVPSNSELVETGEFGGERERERAEGESARVYGGRVPLYQKNRYDVFMRMVARGVCQADGAAIAARRIPPKKNTKQLRLARGETGPVFYHLSSRPTPPSPSSLRPLRPAIKSDLTSIYLRIFQRPRRPPFLLSSPLPSQRGAGSVAHEFRSGNRLRGAPPLFAQGLASLIRSCSYRSGSLGIEILRIGFIGCFFLLPCRGEMGAGILAGLASDSRMLTFFPMVGY